MNAEGTRPMPQFAETGRIMVVDDQPANLKLMEDMLRRDGYTVRSFPSGRLALASVSELPPDLCRDRCSVGSDSGNRNSGRCRRPDEFGVDARLGRCLRCNVHIEVVHPPEMGWLTRRVRASL
jgi:hypothetical protein